MKKILFSIILSLSIFATSLGLNTSTVKAATPDYSRVFEVNYYMANNPDLVKTLGKNTEKYLSHFINTGMSEGRKATGSHEITDYARCFRL